MKTILSLFALCVVSFGQAVPTPNPGDPIKANSKWTATPNPGEPLYNGSRWIVVPNPGEPILAAGGTTMPTGAVGIWYADQYSTSPRAYIPNSLYASTPATSSVANSRRRVFGNPRSGWLVTNLTVVNNAATCPDGTTQAATLAGTGYLELDLPSAAYTLGAWVKSNTGGDTTFKLAMDSGFTVFTATTTWTRFSKSGTGQTLLLRSPDDGTTPINVQVCDIEAYPGASDLYASEPALVGHLYPGKTALDGTFSYASGALNLTGTSAIVQFPTFTDFSQFTMIGVLSQTRPTVSLQTLMSSTMSTTSAYDPGDLSVLIDNSADTNAVLSNNFLTPKTRNLLSFSTPWYMYGVRYDGTNSDFWLDDIRIARVTQSVGSIVSLADFAVNEFVYGKTNPNQGDNKFAALALYPRALSDAEMRQAYTFLAARVALSGNTIAAERIYVAEGDSISAQTNSPVTYPTRFGPNASPVVHGANNAVSGSQVSDLVNRAAFDDATIPPNKAGRTFILSVLIGRNDLAANGNDYTTFLNNLAPYLDARRAAGWKVVLGTLLPSTASGYNAARNAANVIMRTWVGTHCDYIVDFAADPTMGPDAAAADTTYYSDGTHPTSAGQAILETVIRPIINAIP